MPGNLLNIVPVAQAELGLFPVATTVIGNTDNTVQQMLALTNALGQELSTERDWRILVRNDTIITNLTTTVTANITDDSESITITSGSIPSLYYDRYVLSGTGIQIGSRIVANPSAGVYTLDSACTATATGVTVTISQDRYPLDSDFDHFVNQTQWDRTNHWALIGPYSDQESGWLHNGVVTIGPRRRYRLVGGETPYVGGQTKQMEIFPPPSSTDSVLTLPFSYVSNGWVMYLSGASYLRKSAFLTDSDTCLYPTRLMVAGLKYKFWQAKGFDTTGLATEFEREKQKAGAQDAGGALLNMRRRKLPMFISPGQIQDANFPGP